MSKKHIFDMTGKVCIITGGSGYLGTAIIEAMKDLGAIMVNADVMQRPEGKEDLFCMCNMREKDAFQKLFKTVHDTYGRIDAVINCALYGPQRKWCHYIGQMEDEDWSEYLEGTLTTTFRSIRDSIPYLKEHGGSIVNFCSMYGLVSPDFRIYGDDPLNPARNPPCYGAAKAGVQQLTKYAACDLAKFGIRVNCVSPGPFPRPSNQVDDFAQKLGAKTMLGRIGVNTEIAGAVALLCSDASTYMTGSNIVVDGGWTAW